MSDRYNQYRILYCLYDTHFNGQINGIDIMTLMQHESLKYIVRNKLIGEIYYLYGHGLIGIDGISSPFVKITSRGIDIVNIILDKYHNFLKDIRDANLDGAYNNILAMIDSVEKRRTTNFYITKNTDAFKRFLINTNIFDRLLTLPPNYIQHYKDINRQIIGQHIKTLSELPIGERIPKLEDKYMERKASFKFNTLKKGQTQNVKKQYLKQLQDSPIPTAESYL